MKIEKLKKLSIAYAMALCCQPLLAMENQHQFPGNLQHNTEAKKLTLTEMNVHKMLLLKAYMNNMEVPNDVSNIITRNLHDVTHINPLLDGKLIYTPDNGEEATFNIKDLINPNGCIDLSDEIFGDASRYLLITTDLEQFFSFKEDSRRLVMLIAPQFLIEEKIEPSAKPFEEIMDNWQAPIGIFWRVEGTKNLGSYWYLTSKNLIEISKNNVYKLILMASMTRTLKTATDAESPPAFPRSIILLQAFMLICEPK